MVRILAILFGIAFIFGGVAGYGVMPQFVENGLLFGYFEVDTIHNLVHIVTGVLAIMAATSYRLSKLFFILFGLIYAAAAVLGFWHQGDLYIMHADMADNYLHAGVAIIALLIGFSAKSRG
jgi:hypothetical protein